MLDNERREYIQKALSQRNINKYKAVSGKRFSVPCGDHEISVIYYPAEREHAPLLLGFHGGGFLFGGNAMNDKMWHTMAKEFDVNVASIEYRKSPQYGYKEALEDAMAACIWFSQHAKDYNADPERISVIGFSAGANLAAALCLMLKEQNLCKIEHQILIYPYLDAHTDPAKKGDGHPLMYLFNELHSTKEETKHPLLSPLYATDSQLNGLPETWLVMADHDALKPEGYAYGERLMKNSVKVHITCARHMPHEYFEAAFGDYTEPALKEKTPEFYKLIHSGKALTAAHQTLEFLKPAFS